MEFSDRFESKFGLECMYVLECVWEKDTTDWKFNILLGV